MTDDYQNGIRTDSQSETGFEEIQDDFIQHWGEKGTLWGINKAMGQLHALLLSSNEPLSVDYMMARLDMSRGNVSMNIRELKNWGVVHAFYRKGDRKVYYIAENDMWTVIERIFKERKKREIEPTADLINKCIQELSLLDSEKADVFKQRIKNMHSFIQDFNSIAEYILNARKIDPIKLASMILPILRLRKK